MAWMTNWWSDFKEDLKEITNRQWQVLGITAGSVLVALILFLFFVPQIQNNIRQSQLDAIVYPPVVKEKVKIVSTTELAQTVKEQKAVTVIFLRNGRTLTKEAWEILGDEKALGDLNHQVYVYPLVYDAKETIEKYQLADDSVTCVFYEKGKEENRYTLKTNATKDWMEQLNALPMANVKELD